MSAHRVYLGLGTNLGSRLENIRAALHVLPPEVTSLRASPVYETPPWGVLNQPKFLNLAVECETVLPPMDLLDHLKAIETGLGRVESQRFGPRLIDLDILLYDQVIVNTDLLEIPHPRLSERAFVLVPLTDLIPDFLHPLSDLSIRALLSRVDTSEIRLHPLPSGFVLLPDPAFPSLPVDIAAGLLNQSPAAKKFFHLPPSHRREYIQYIQEAKKPDTRRRRIDRMIAALLTGHGPKRDEDETAP